MEPAQIIAALHAAGVRLDAAGDRLVLDGCQDRLSEELIAAIRERKSALLDHLRANPAQLLGELRRAGAAQTPTEGTTPLGGGSPPAPQPEVRGIDTADDVQRLAVLIARSGTVALDLERSGDDPRLHAATRVWVAVPGDAVYVVEPHRVGPIRVLGLALEACEVVGHGLQPVCAVLAARYGVNLRSLWDVEVASKLLAGGLDSSEDAQHARAALARRFLGGLAIPSGASVAARAADTMLLLRLREALDRALAGAALAAVASLEFAVIPVVAAMELAGVLVSEGMWRDLLQRRRRRHAEVVHALEAVLGASSLRSEVALRDALRQRGFRVSSTGKEELSQFRGEPARDAIIDLLIEWRALAAFLNDLGPRVLDALRRHPDGRVRASLNSLGTSTGRFSCSNPNLQGMEKRVRDARRCVRPRSGSVFVVADYGAIDLRVLAEFSQDPRLLDSFRRGLCPHTATAAALLGKPHEQVAKEERQLAKVVNFGIVNEMGAASLAERARTLFNVPMTLDQAREHLNRYARLHPGVAAWKRTMGQAAGRRETRTKLGRLRRWAATAEGFFPEFVNAPIQGTGADGLKLAMVLLHARLRRLDSRLVMCVHDEIVVEAPEAHAEDARRLVRDTMIEAMAEYVRTVPIDVVAEIRTTWAEAEK